MSELPPPATSSSNWNLPNLISSLRLVLAIGLFVALAWQEYAVSLALFLVAAATDWLDGWYARRYGQVTFLGRILDPFADKVMICGTFIFLLAAQPLVEMPWGLRPWMVVVIVAREMFVTALRSFLEERGVDFSAKRSGKWKMFLQTVAVFAALCYLAFPSGVQKIPWAAGAVQLLFWGAVLQTIFSGLLYGKAAAKLLRS